MLGGFRRVCKNNETTVTNGDQLVMKATITLDPSRTPRTIDYHMIEGPPTGQTQLGIYEIGETTIRFSFSPVGAPRPADFTSTVGDRRTESVWKPRAAPADLQLVTLNPTRSLASPAGLDTDSSSRYSPGARPASGRSHRYTVPPDGRSIGRSRIV